MKFIEELKTNLCWNDQHIKQLLEISNNEYEIKFKTSGFTFKDIEKLCHALHIEMDLIVKSPLDFSKIRRRLSNQNDSIPDKYLAGAGTYMEFVRVVYNFIRNVYNENVSQQILKNLGMPPEVLLNDDIMVNSQLINDLMDVLTNELNIDKKSIRDLSLSGYTSEKRKNVIRIISDENDEFEIMKKLAKNSNSWEKNFEYVAEKIDQNYFIMKSKSAEFANDLAGKAELVTEQTILYKKFIIETIYPMLGKKMPKIVDIENRVSNGRQEVNYLFKIH